MAEARAYIPEIFPQYIPPLGARAEHSRKEHRERLKERTLDEWLASRTWEEFKAIPRALQEELERVVAKALKEILEEAIKKGSSEGLEAAIEKALQGEWEEAIKKISVTRKAEVLREELLNDILLHLRDAYNPTLEEEQANPSALPEGVDLLYKPWDGQGGGDGYVYHKNSNSCDTWIALFDIEGHGESRAGIKFLFEKGVRMILQDPHLEQTNVHAELNQFLISVQNQCDVGMGLRSSFQMARLHKDGDSTRLALYPPVSESYILVRDNENGKLYTNFTDYPPMRMEEGALAENQMKLGFFAEDRWYEDYIPKDVKEELALGDNYQVILLTDGVLTCPPQYFRNGKTWEDWHDSKNRESNFDHDISALSQEVLDDKSGKTFWNRFKAKIVSNRDTLKNPDRMAQKEIATKVADEASDNDYRALADDVTGIRINPAPSHKVFNPA